MTQAGSTFTAGPWRANGCIIEGPKMGLQVAQVQFRAAGSNVGFAPQTKAEAFATAELIAEAGTIAHETGLTPRQLAERCKELEEAARSAHRYLDSHGNGWEEADTLRELAAALSKATAGGAV